MGKLQYTFVHVPTATLSSPVWGPSEQYASPKGHEGTYTRLGRTGSWMKSVEKQVYLGDSLKTITEDFNAFAKELGVDVDTIRLDIRHEPVAYEDHEEMNTYLISERPATAEEVQTVVSYRAWQAGEQEARTSQARQRIIDQAKRAGITAEDLA